MNWIQAESLVYDSFPFFCELVLFDIFVNILTACYTYQCIDDATLEIAEIFDYHSDIFVVKLASNLDIKHACHIKFSSCNCC